MPIFKEKNIAVVEKRFGGKGSVIIEHVLDESLYQGKIPIYIKSTLKPGCSLGYHKHEGNSEAYFILAGTGTYNDNGILSEVTAGDTTFTPDGESLGIENTGTEDLVFMALVVSTKWQ